MSTITETDCKIVGACKAAVETYELYVEYCGNLTAAERRATATDEASFKNWEVGRDHCYQQYQNALREVRRLAANHPATYWAAPFRPSLHPSHAGLHAPT